MDAQQAGAAALVVTLAGWFAFELSGIRRTRGDAVVADQRSMLVLRLATLLALVLAVLVGRLVPQAGFARTAALWLSLPLIWAGVAIRWRSRRALGVYFTYTVQTSSDQVIVDTGPYRWVRHPAYTGMLLALVGVAILLGNWVSLLVFLPLVLVGVVYRIRVEEAALLRAPGRPYAHYAAGRARLVPHVW